MDCSINSLLQFSAGICTANAAYPNRQKCPYRKVGQRIDLLYPQERTTRKPGRLLHCPEGRLHSGRSRPTRPCPLSGTHVFQWNDPLPR